MLKYLYALLVIVFTISPVAYALENTIAKSDQMNSITSDQKPTEGRKAVIVTRTTIDVVELIPSDDNKSLKVKEISKIVQPGIIKDPSVDINDEKLKAMAKEAFDEGMLKQGDSITLGIGTDIGSLVGMGAGLVAPAVQVVTFVVPKVLSAGETIVGLAKNLLAFL